MQSNIVSGLWKHKTHGIRFVLVMDDFGIKYLKKEDLDHTIHVLIRHYDVTVDLDGKEFVKIELDCNYERGRVHLSMQPYLQKALRQFNDAIPTKKEDSTYQHTPPKFGVKEQFVEYDTSAPIGRTEQKDLQTIRGKFLWYAQGVDATILLALNALPAQQAKPTQQAIKQAQQLLHYCATQEPAVLTYLKSDMVLAIHSDAGYLNKDNARSHAGGHHYLVEDLKFPPNNGVIHNIAEII